MTAKTFLVFRLIAAALIASVVSVSMVRGDYIVPLLTVLTFAILLYAMKKKVKDVIEDERDYAIAGKAARWAITIFAAIASLPIIVLFSQRQADPVYEAVGSALAYSVCGLMLLYSLLFKYFQSRGK